MVKTVFWDTSPPFSWSMGFPVKSQFLAPTTLLNLVASLEASSMSLDSVKMLNIGSIFKICGKIMKKNTKRKKIFSLVQRLYIIESLQTMNRLAGRNRGSFSISIYQSSLLVVEMNTKVLTFILCSFWQIPHLFPSACLPLPQISSLPSLWSATMALFLIPHKVKSRHSPSPVRQKALVPKAQSLHSFYLIKIEDLMLKEKKSWLITRCELQNWQSSGSDKVGQFVDFQDPEV